MDRPNRRTVVLAVAAMLAPAASAAQTVALPSIRIYRAPGCGCCTAWSSQFARAGFRTRIVDETDLPGLRRRVGIPAGLASCHTAFLSGYYLEGHVPIADVQELVRSRPRGLGLVVPGMPVGSPGMEAPHLRREPFNTLLVLDRRGAARVFARHS